MEKKINRAIKLYPWYWATGADLLFYISIDTLFLTTVKQFSEMQILLMTAISTLAAIVLRFPILWIVKKAGNSFTIKIGGFCLLLASALITVGPNFFVIILGRCFRTLTQVINEAAVIVALENNLEHIGRPQDFVKYRTRGTSYYAAVTLGIALVATFLFQVNPYLPMLCCICSSATAFGLTFFIADFSEHNRPMIQKKERHEKFKSARFVVFAIVGYGIAFSIAKNGITDAKLYIQQDILTKTSLEVTTTIIGIVYFLSRIVRLASNMVFTRIYTWLRLKTGVLFVGMLACAYSLLILGAVIPELPEKVVVMSIGYFLILFSIDPIRHYVQQILVRHTPREQHARLFSYMGLAEHICNGISSMAFSMILLRFTLTSVMGLCGALSAIAAVLMVLVYVRLRR